MRKGTLLQVFKIQFLIFRANYCQNSNSYAHKVSGTYPLNFLRSTLLAFDMGLLLHLQESRHYSFLKIQDE
jgi:hypothetical protein